MCVAAIRSTPVISHFTALPLLNFESVQPRSKATGHTPTYRFRFFIFLSVVFIHKYPYAILCEKSCPTAEMLRAALIRILEADMCSSTVLLWRRDVKEKRCPL